MGNFVVGFYLLLLLYVTERVVLSLNTSINGAPSGNSLARFPHLQQTDKPPAFPSNFAYKKCFCDIHKVWNGKECITLDPKIILEQLNVLQPTSEKFLSFILAEVDIRSNISCDEPNRQVKATNEIVYILDNGDLFHEVSEMYFPSDSYCFEFEVDDDLGTLSTITQVCLPPPNLPFCCKGNKCSDVLYMEPQSVFWGETEVQWTKYNLQKVEEPICDDRNHVNNLPFTDVHQIALLQDFESAQLVFTTSRPEKEVAQFYFSPLEFCIKRNNSNQLSATFCYDDPYAEHIRRCHNSTCIRKCCPPNLLYNELYKNCSSTANEQYFIPTLHHLENRTLLSNPKNLQMEYDFPWCRPSKPFILDPETRPFDDFYLLPNGSLYMALSSLTMPVSKYCVDYFLDASGVTSVKAISCFLETKKMDSDICTKVQDNLYPVLMVISCIFLAVTLIVYASIPELRTKLHGKCLLSHVSSLMIAYLCKLIISWGTTSLTMIGCKVIGLATQVSFLWAFFWLNVMCFDIWWTLKSMNPSPETGESSRIRFILYSIYAWGCPLFICFITGLIEFLEISIRKSGWKFIFPGLGIRHCWFQDKASTWLYFHGYTLFLFVINILFFIHVAAILIKSQRSTEGILRTTRKQQQERIYLYLKLFIVMGITWIFEVVSWQEGSCEYWLVSDIINTLQGMFIFFIFMWNKKVYQKQIHEKVVPFFIRVKRIVRTPSTMASINRRTSSQRTTQTSLESSSRRLSNSIPLPDIQQCIQK